MKTTWIKLGIVVLIVGLAAMGCEEAGTASGPSVDGVDTAQLTETADESSLTSISGTGIAPTDKTQVLDTIGSGIDLMISVFEDYTDANPDWEPTTGTLELTPEDLFDLDQPPTEAGITGTLDGEEFDFSEVGFGTSGTMEVSGTAGVAATMTWREFTDEFGWTEYYPDFIDVTSTFENVTADMTGIDDSDTVFVPAGRLAMSANANVQVDPSYDGDGFVTQVGAAYAVSAVAQLAISVDSTSEFDYTGNFVVEMSLGVNDQLVLSEAMFEDEQALEEYLEARVNQVNLTLTVKHWNNAGDELLETYTYSQQEIFDYISSQASDL